MSVENDGQPANMVLLTNLKTLFQKQLPVMPREYITRLVFDPNQKCLAIVKSGYKVVGGICYRPFPHRKFAEIVFFATHSVDQVKVCPPLDVTRGSMLTTRRRVMVACS
jgi:histone acetyltransferase